MELDDGGASDAAGTAAQPAKRRKSSAMDAPAALPGTVKSHGAAGALGMSCRWDKCLSKLSCKR